MGRRLTVSQAIPWSSVFSFAWSSSLYFFERANRPQHGQANGSNGGTITAK